MCMYASQKRQMLQRRGGTFGIPDKSKFNIISSEILHSDCNLIYYDINATFSCLFFGRYDGFQLSEQMFH